LYEWRYFSNHSCTCLYPILPKVTLLGCTRHSFCSTEYEVCDTFASLTRHQTSYSGSAGWYFRYQSIHIQITFQARRIKLYEWRYFSNHSWTCLYPILPKVTLLGCTRHSFWFDISWKSRHLYISYAGTNTLFYFLLKWYVYVKYLHSYNFILLAWNPYIYKY
jgi:hypothetical protein